MLMRCTASLFVILGNSLSDVYLRYPVPRADHVTTALQWPLLPLTFGLSVGEGGRAVYQGQIVDKHQVLHSGLLGMPFSFPPFHVVLIPFSFHPSLF